MRGASRRIAGIVRRLDRRQVVFLSVLFLVAAGAFGFIELAEEMGEEDAGAFDRSVLLSFRRPGDPARLRGPAWLEEAVRDLTALGGVSVLTLVVSVFAGYLLLARRYRLAAMLLAATLGGVLLVAGLKSLFGRVRPDVVPHLVEEASASFPSGHSAMSAMVYLTVGSILASSQTRLRLRLYIFSVMFLISFLVGLTRIMLGVHYPTDVLAGWSLGLAWSSVCWFAALLLKYRGTLFRRRAPGPK